MKMDPSIKTIDSFIATYPKEVQVILQQLRQAIHDAAPEAGEKISYGIPTFTYRGNLVHFSAYEKHVGFYPGAAPIAAFAKKLKGYETAKGTVRFPLDKPLPIPLIQDMVRYRVKQYEDEDR